MYRNVATLLALEVLQRIGIHLRPATTVLEDVYRRIDSLTHRLRIGQVLTCNVVRHTVVGRCAHLRQCRRKIHTLGRNGLERSQTLIVIHCQHCVILLECATREETISGKGTKRQHLLLEGLLHRGANHLLLLCTEQTSVARVGVECQHRNTRLDNGKVATQRGAQTVQSLDDLLLRDRFRHLRQRNMNGHQTDTQNLAAHHHHRLALQLGSQKLGMSRIAEIVALNTLFIDRGSNQNIDIARLQITNGSLQRCYRSSTRFGCGLTHLDRYLRRTAIEDIDLTTTRLRNRLNGVVDESLNVAQSIFVICRHFGRAVDHRHKALGHTCVSESFDYNLPADAVGIALRDAYSYFVITHCVLVYLSTYKDSNIYSIRNSQFAIHDYFL